MSETTQVIIPGGCLQNTKISLKCKAPDEKIEYTFSLASQLSSDEEIVSVQAQPPYRSSLTVDSYAYNVNIFTCRISGGRMLYDEPIRFVISTQKNTIYSFVCVLPIRQQGILIENCCGMNGVLDPATPMGTLAVGTTTTLEPGSKATVENIGSDNAAVLNFGIPKGEEGLAATVTVGTVTKGDAGSDPVVTNIGTLNAAILDFTLPTGENGETPTIQVGETTTLPAGHDATVKATTKDGIIILDFGIPSGTTGEAGQYILNIGTVNTLSPGQNATAEITSNGQGTHLLNLGIPQGNAGENGQDGTRIEDISITPTGFNFKTSDGKSLEVVPEGIYIENDNLVAPNNIGELPDDLLLNGNIYTVTDTYLNGTKQLPTGLSLNSNIIMTDGSVFFPKTINNNGVLCAA